jgi:hypothetical protein
MGIRYYAYPVRERDITAARADPCAFHGDDPLVDAWGPEEERPEMLYLDKCWRELQTLFGEPPRPALRLVEGAVTFMNGGAEWRAFEQVLDPEQVQAIADDIALVTDADVSRMIAENECYAYHGQEEEFRYVSEYLHRAQQFVAALAERKLGLVYLIG